MSDDLHFKSLAVASQRAEQRFIAPGAVVVVEDNRYRLDEIGPDGAQWVPLPEPGYRACVPVLRDSGEPATANEVHRALAAIRRPRTLPDDSDARKEIPIAEGVLFYFPAALAEVARISKIGNDKHNPGEPLHHARGKSMDHEDCIVRHTLDARESGGGERTEHLANRAWRALAALQEHCEAQGAPLAPNAREASE